MNKLENVSPQQQKEGLQFVVETVPPTIFRRAVYNLARCRFISKSQAGRYLTLYRKIKGWSYDEFRSQSSQKYQGKPE